ncbi:response regulator transcription factor [Singulisphaera sp. PoT]|uniref:response regulator transcription factor n=1 Tax=Singulisphaera sp. PoT TaxID=3411797 RepID=UPI003BF4728B
MPSALIVEDEPEANHLLAMLVQLRGYRTDSAYTGGEALEKVREQPPDIVFLDLMLPDMNGYEVCRALKTKKATSLIPIVMVTARVAAENRLQSFRVGADDYIPKPYTPDQIFQAMTEADAWRRDVQGPVAEGQIQLDASEDGESLRQIAQLRSLLVARTPLDVDSISRIGAALTEIVSDACMAKGSDTATAGVIDYSLQPDRLTLTLREASSWLAKGLLVREGRLSRWLTEARFDEIDGDNNAAEVVFVKRFPPACPEASL